MTVAAVAFGLMSGVAFNVAYAAEDETDLDSELINPMTTELMQTDQKTQIMISDTCYYDTEQKLYYYNLSGLAKSTFSSNVADGMITQNRVSLHFPKGLTYSLYKDGKEIENYKGDSVTEPGSYTLAMYDGYGNTVTPLTFTVLGKFTNNRNLTLSGTSCRFTDFQWEENAMEFSENTVSFVQEGEYHIEYECINNKKTYSLNVKVDHTAPVLALKEVNEKMQANGPVDISDLEEGATISITRDNNPVSKKDVLTDSGRYRIIVMDEAGNKASYEFTILVYFDTNSTIFLILLAVVILAVCVYLYVSRKHLRVR